MLILFSVPISKHKTLNCTCIFNQKHKKNENENENERKKFVEIEFAHNSNHIANTDLITVRIFSS